LTGTAKGKITSAPFLTNKLTTLTLEKGIDGGGTTYTVALTGGTVTISNNITYLTPELLGIVNIPAASFTGTRAISGSINAYLRAGSTNTAGLLNDMLTSSTSDVRPSYKLQIELNGAANANRVEIEMPATVLTIPSVSTEQVISTTINFTAQGYTGSAFDLTASNEVEIRYYTTNAA
jgi:hypothetical protein